VWEGVGLVFHVGHTDLNVVEIHQIPCISGEEILGETVIIYKEKQLCKELEGRLSKK